MMMSMPTASQATSSCETMSEQAQSPQKGCFIHLGFGAPFTSREP